MTLCRAGLHDLDDPAVGAVQKSNGRRYCRACRAAYKRAKRREANPMAGMCKRGLHDLTDPANLYVSPKGKRSCHPCKLSKPRRRKPEPEPEEPTRVISPAAVPPAGIRGGVLAGEAAARYRLALRVRGLP